MGKAPISGWAEIKIPAKMVAKGSGKKVAGGGLMGDEIRGNGTGMDVGLKIGGATVLNLY